MDSDVDFYTMVATGPVSAEVEAECGVEAVLVYGGDCADPEQIYTIQDRCHVGSLAWNTVAGQQVWLVVWPTTQVEVLAERPYTLHVCGIEEMLPTPTARSSWGRIKTRYRCGTR